MRAIWCYGTKYISTFAASVEEKLKTKLVFSASDLLISLIAFLTLILGTASQTPLGGYNQNQGACYPLDIWGVLTPWMNHYTLSYKLRFYSNRSHNWLETRCGNSGNVRTFLLKWIIPALLSNHAPSKVWVEIIYPFPNFNGCTVEVCEWISNFSPPIKIVTITTPPPPKLGLKLIHVMGHLF